MNILEIKEVCSPLWGLKYFTYKKEVPKAKNLQNVFNVRGVEELEKKGPYFLFVSPI